MNLTRAWYENDKLVMSGEPPGALRLLLTVAPYQSTLGLAVPGGFCVRASQRLLC